MSGHSPLVRDSISRSASKFDVVFDEPKGWEKFNRTHWLNNLSRLLRVLRRSDFSGETLDEGLGRRRAPLRRPGDGETLALIGLLPPPVRYPIDEAMYRRALPAHPGVADPTGRKTRSRRLQCLKRLLELTGGELHILGVGRGNARFPAWANTTVRDFLADRLGTWKPEAGCALARSVRSTCHPDWSGSCAPRSGRRPGTTCIAGRCIDWLAQDPVTFPQRQQ